jgi:hypothetical protein
MTFDEVLEQVITLLTRQGRISYRALKRRFDLDDEYIEDLKAELIQAQRLVRIILICCCHKTPLTMHEIAKVVNRGAI